MTGADPEPGRQVRVWDRPTRVFHWVLVVLFIVCYVSGDRGRFDIHVIAGQALLILVVARIIWGFVGSDTARFRHFLRPVGEIVAHVRSLGERRPGHDAGHNPLGGLSVALMLFVLVVHMVSGLFAVDVDGWNEGPLSHVVSYEAARNASGVHAVTVDILLVLVALHVAAVGFHWLYKRDNLVLPMVTGRKRLPPDREAPRLVPDLYALAALAVAASAVLGVVSLAG
ncbi:MAG: cytochrome b/b6 domain-containing protein [bacterium]|nr:cytochrome b/b6 domain-containing protein [bacterium]